MRAHPTTWNDVNILLSKPYQFTEKRFEENHPVYTRAFTYSAIRSYVSYPQPYYNGLKSGPVLRLRARSSNNNCQSFARALKPNPYLSRHPLDPTSSRSPRVVVDARTRAHIVLLSYSIIYYTRTRKSAEIAFITASKGLVKI